MVKPTLAATDYYIKLRDKQTFVYQVENTATHLQL